MNDHALQAAIDRIWDLSIVPALTKYIRIPAQSPDFDPEWAQNGHIDAAVELARAWVDSRALRGARVEVLRAEGRTPLLWVEVEGQRPGTVLMYGHLDKQPPFEGWRTEEGLGPWTPKMVDGRLYGRGGADDGYAVFASVAAVEALQAQGVKLPRIVMTIECSEESGSPDLPYYINRYAERIGDVRLVICLDSGSGDYERMWVTTSLRGLLAVSLRVDVLENGVHSGDASGVVPSSFRIARALLSRLEDAETGAIIPEALHVPIPAERAVQATAAAEVLGDAVSGKFPWVEGMSAIGERPAERLLNKTWRPALSVTGADGLPPVERAGNVLRPFTTLKLSLRLPPTLSPATAKQVLTDVLTQAPPYGARVTLSGDHAGPGWEAPATAPWLDAALRDASNQAFGRPHGALGEGGSIPFMGMLGERFPTAQFVITGVLGPQSNAHGPNEFLDVPFSKKLTAAVATILSRVPEA